MILSDTLANETLDEREEEERDDERWCPRRCRCPRGCVEKGEEGPGAATAGAYAYGSYVDAYPESDVPVNVAGVACERGASESYSGGSNGFTFSALGGSFSPRAVIIVFVFRLEWNMIRVWYKCECMRER